MTDDQTKTLALLVAKLTKLGFTAVPSDKGVTEGPVVSVYRLRPTGRTRVRDIESLAHDFAVALQAENVLVKRLPGEDSVSVFVPNAVRRWPSLSETLGEAFSARLKVPLGLGIDYVGRPVVEDLSELPHILIAGSTGSGKSSLLSNLLTTMVYCCKPENVSLILSDTKGVEFGQFVGLPHLLFPPATNVFQTMERMQWLSEEIERRLRVFVPHGVKNVSEYNERVLSSQKMAYIVMVFDELADILTDPSKTDDKGPRLGKICEAMLNRIVQKSRASGIFVIAATQRPSVNIVAGCIKANFVARLSFRLPTEADSRTILGIGGAEHLLGKGDCLFVSPTRGAELLRIHVPWTKSDEVKYALELVSSRSENET